MNTYYIKLKFVKYSVYTASTVKCGNQYRVLSYLGISRYRQHKL